MAGAGLLEITRRIKRICHNFSDPKAHSAGNQDDFQLSVTLIYDTFQASTKILFNIINR